MGTGISKLYRNTVGAKESSSNTVELPKNNAQLKHIFSDRDGHLPDSPENRRLLLDLANDTSCFYGKDKYGNSWNIMIDIEGRQVWVRYRGGVINEGGRNATPRSWNSETGLNRNPFKEKKK